VVVVMAAGRNRDRELLGFVGRHGIVAVPQVMAAMEAGRSVTYDRIAACVDRGLIERLRLLRDEPTVIRSTRDGLDHAGLGLPVASVKPGLVRHHLACAEVAIRAERHYGSGRILTEREFAWRERAEGRRLAAVQVGRAGRHGAPKVHRADLAILTDEGVIAVEVELTAKAPTRLETLVRAWRAARLRGDVAGVNYLCEPGQTRRAVERAVQKVGAQDSVAVGEVPS
jgi:hypothetical protein